jgi:hypothetical protein
MHVRFRSSEEESAWFECGPSLWPVSAGQVHIDQNRGVSIVRGWFFSPVPVAVYAIGTLIVVKERVEGRVPGLIVTLVEPALDLFRHECTTESGEVPGTGPWHPPREPLDLDELKRLWSADADGASVQFTSEGGFCCAPRCLRRRR